MHGQEKLEGKGTVVSSTDAEPRYKLSDDYTDTRPIGDMLRQLCGHLTGEIREDPYEMQRKLAKADWENFPLGPGKDSPRTEAAASRNHVQFPRRDGKGRGPSWGLSRTSRTTTNFNAALRESHAASRSKSIRKPPPILRF